jgi:hypothetical protein
MKSSMKLLLGLYVALGIISMGFQIYYRYPDCSEAIGCGKSFAKGVVWSAIWPAYWATQEGWLR